jgi:hypothetical protein
MKAKNRLSVLLCPKFWGENHGLPIKITLLLLAASLIVNLFYAN